MSRRVGNVDKIVRADAHPLLIHGVRVSSHADENVKAAARLWESGGSIVPIDRRDPSTPSRSMILGLDRDAGDGRFVFLSACNVVHSAAAFAFKFDDLASIGRVLWRGHDLMGVYRWLDWKTGIDRLSALRKAAESMTSFSTASARRVAELWGSVRRQDEDMESASAEVRRIWEKSIRDSQRARAFRRAVGKDGDDVFDHSAPPALHLHAPPWLSNAREDDSCSSPEFLVSFPLPVRMAVAVYHPVKRTWAAPSLEQE